jgi:hypothetical protein
MKSFETSIMMQDDSVGPVRAAHFVSVLPNCHLTSEGEKFKSIVIDEDPILENIYQPFPFYFVFLSPQFCDVMKVTSSIEDLPNMAICKI